MDSTLQEVLLTLRAVASPAPSFNTASGNINPTASPELHHPLAKYTFRSVYPDPATGGRFQSKDLGDVYARDLSDIAIFDKPFPVLSEPVEVKMEDTLKKEAVDDIPGVFADPSGERPVEEAMDTTDTAAPNDTNGKDAGKHTTGRESRTLQDLRFRKGDYLAISVRFPKAAATSGIPPISTTIGAGIPAGLSIRGSAGGPPIPGRGGFGVRDVGPVRQIPWVTSPVTPTTGTNPRDVRRGAHWRGGAPTGPSRGGFGGKPDGPGDRRAIPSPREERNVDRRWGSRVGRSGGLLRGGRRSRSRSRSPRRSRSRDLSMASSRSRRSKSLSKSRSPPPRRDTN
jgi:histone deacetylase complex subunit SAP18